MRPLLRGLLRAAGLELVPAEDVVTSTLGGIIEVCDASPDENAFGRYSVPSFRLQLTDDDAHTSTVSFSDSKTVPSLLRGRKIFTETVSGSLVRLPVGETLAAADRSSVWTSKSEHGRRHDAAVLSRSASRKGTCLFQHLNGQRFMGLLPLLEWARSISGWHHWNKPPTRACFMIDDPNLHSTSYGFVSFKELIAEGRRHGFHTSLAIIPLDQYYVSPAAAELLREGSDAISLLVHGNNHTHRELAGSEPPELQLAMMRQALARIGRFERKTRFAVARVMAPPHSACSVDMMRALAQAGFEAATMSHGSVHAAAGAFEWIAGIGADLTMVIRGLPVIPRFGLGGHFETQALISAYLGQPIIAVGHHWDLKDGAGSLIEGARSIGALGEVIWSDMTTIARANYHWKTETDTLSVRSFSHNLHLQVPEGIRTLAVEFASLGESDVTLTCRIVPDGLPLESAFSNGGGWSFSVPPGPCVLQVAAIPLRGAEPRDVTNAATPLRAVVRRCLTEARDRLSPWIRRDTSRG
jgi:hypothetical protein